MLLTTYGFICFQHSINNAIAKGFEAFGVQMDPVSALVLTTTDTVLVCPKGNVSFTLFGKKIIRVVDPIVVFFDVSESLKV